MVGMCLQKNGGKVSARESSPPLSVHPSSDFYKAASNDLENAHRTCSDADAAGNAFRHLLRLLGVGDDVHRTYLTAVTATGTELLVDDEDTGLRILCDGLVRAGAHALAALETHFQNRVAVCVSFQTDAGHFGVEAVIKSVCAGKFTAVTSHTGLLIGTNHSFFHCKSSVCATLLIILFSHFENFLSISEYYKNALHKLAKMPNLI